jgi:hypothetical protein
MMDFTPIPGYGDDSDNDGNPDYLVSQDMTVNGELHTGVIPKIDSTLPEGIYYLVEDIPPEGYEPIETGINYFRFQITAMDGPVLLSGGQTAELTHNPEDLYDPDTAVDEVTYTLKVMNKRSITDYYFDIEKIALLDKNVHGAENDPNQKFVFLVEHFDEPYSDSAVPADSFYVTVNCKSADALQAYPYSGNLSAGVGKHYDAETNTVRRTYTDQNGDTQTYTYPAAIFEGKQTVHVRQKGVYRISEVSSWSGTDYDFWEQSNIYQNGIGDAIRQKQTDGYVIFSVDEVHADRFKDPSYTENGVTKYRPLASFTNCETEYAYLSAQAYAENSIFRRD